MNLANGVEFNPTVKTNNKQETRRKNGKKIKNIVTQLK